MRSKKLLLVFVAMVFLLPFGACNGKWNPVAPSPSDPGGGANPSPDNPPAENPWPMPDGMGTIRIDQMDPLPGRSAKIGQRAMVWTTVTNNSDLPLWIRVGAADSADDMSREGRPSSLFDGGFRGVNPGTSNQVIFGYIVGSSERIPFLHLAGYYGESTRGKPAWVHNIRLDWCLGDIC